MYFPNAFTLLLLTNVSHVIDLQELRDNLLIQSDDVSRRGCKMQEFSHVLRHKLRNK
jgi:hypothetical protein